MDIEPIKETLRSLDWKASVKTVSLAIILILGVAFVLSIIGAIFIGIPVFVISLLKILYEFITTLEEKYYYTAGLIALVVVLMVVFRRVGLVSLSSQSLSHRRNIFFAFFLVFLIENFDLNVAKMFKADDNDQIIAATKGILALFALYSFVEYAHNLLHDFLRSRNDSKILENPLLFRSPKLIDIWLVLIGNYRVLFDIALPVATSVFIFFIYKNDVSTVYDTGKKYVSTEIKLYLENPKNSEIKFLTEKASGEINIAIKSVVEVQREAEEVTGEVYEKLEKKLNKQSNYKNEP